MYPLMPEKNISYYRRCLSQFLFGSCPAGMPGQKRKANTWRWLKQGWTQDAAAEWVPPNTGGDGPGAPPGGGAATTGGPSMPSNSNEYDQDGGLQG